MHHAYIKPMLLWGFEKSLPVSLGTDVMDGAHENLCIFVYVFVCGHVYIYISIYTHIYMYYVCIYTHKYIKDPCLHQQETNMITAV
jgi:hypothetical protein